MAGITKLISSRDDYVGDNFSILSFSRRDPKVSSQEISLPLITFSAFINYYAEPS